MVFQRTTGGIHRKVHIRGTCTKGCMVQLQRGDCQQLAAVGQHDAKVRVWSARLERCGQWDPPSHDTHSRHAPCWARLEHVRVLLQQPDHIQCVTASLGHRYSLQGHLPAVVARLTGARSCTHVPACVKWAGESLHRRAALVASFRNTMLRGTSHDADVKGYPELRESCCPTDHSRPYANPRRCRRCRAGLLGLAGACRPGHPAAANALTSGNAATMPARSHPAYMPEPASSTTNSAHPSLQPSRLHLGKSQNPGEA